MPSAPRPPPLILRLELYFDLNVQVWPFQKRNLLGTYVNMAVLRYPRVMSSKRIAENNGRAWKSKRPAISEGKVILANDI